MALFRKFFYRKPPDGLLEISERVYVFDCCFTTDVLEDEEYRTYIGGIAGQLRDHLPDASFMVFNFREGDSQSHISDILSEYDMTVMDYPRHYEGCPLLTMEMIHHFLRSSESWLFLGQKNVILMHCERGGWPVLAFMLAALLIYRKQYTGEQKTLDMIYKQAPRELLHLMSPLNPLPSQVRYLQYISRRNLGSQWPPLSRALTLDCIILRFIPNMDGEGGCRPIFRIYGPDPLNLADQSPKVLFSTPKRSKIVRHYKQAECELIKIDINCYIQGDVVLECISLDDDLEHEHMIFRIMFNTSFIRSNILILNRDEIDILWHDKDHFLKGFRAEVIFSEMDASTSLVSIVLPGFEEKEGLPVEAFARVRELFSDVDWLDQKTDVPVNVLQHIKESNILQELETDSTHCSKRGSELLVSSLLNDKEKHVTKAFEDEEGPATIDRVEKSNSVSNLSHDTNSIAKKVVSQELQIALQRPAQAKIISPRAPLSQGSLTPISRYQNASSPLGITALLEDHVSSNNKEAIHCSTSSMTSATSSLPISITRPLQKDPPMHPRPSPLLPPSSPSSADALATIIATSVSSNSISSLSKPVETKIPPGQPTSLLPSSSHYPEEASMWDASSTPDLAAGCQASSETRHSSSFEDETARLSLVPSPPPPPSAPPSLEETSSPTRMGQPPITPPLPNLLSFQGESSFSSGKKASLEPLSSPLPPLLEGTSPSSRVQGSTLCTPPPPLKLTSITNDSITSSPSLSPPPPSITSSATFPISSLEPAESTKVTSRTSSSPPTSPLSSSTPSGLTVRTKTPTVSPSPPSSSGPCSGLPISPKTPSAPSPLSPGPGSGLPITPKTPSAPPPPLSGLGPGLSITPKTSSAPPPPPPPPPLSSGLGSALNITPKTPSAPPPPPPPPSSGPGPGPTPGFAQKNSSKNSAPLPPVPPPPAPFAKGSPRNGNVPPVPGPPSSAAFCAKGQGLARPNFRSQAQSKRNNLKPYHWLKLTRAVQGSLWAETQKSDEASKAPEFDMKELESLFSTATPGSENGGIGAKSNRRVAGLKPDKVQLVELRRANNCEIMLTKVKIPIPDLMSLVLALDDTMLDIDQVENLIKFCPTKEETDLLKGYNGEKESLGKCEQFFLELMKVPRVESKLRVFAFKIQYNSQVSDLKDNLNTVNSASEEIRNSEKLKRIMQTILSLGNALNHGTARGSAVGFRLDSLLKLTDTRARNNKMTLMHYLCKVLAEKLPELLDFPKDLVSLEAATKIQLKYLAEEMQAIHKGLEKVLQELTASENDGPISETFCKTLKEFLSYAEAEVRSLTSLYSNVGRSADALALYFGEDPARCPFEQVVSTLFNFVRMFVRAHEENCKQLELEKKKAQKEAQNEKMKIPPPKEAEHVLRSPVESGNI